MRKSPIALIFATWSLRAEKRRVFKRRGPARQRRHQQRFQAMTAIMNMFFSCRSLRQTVPFESAARHGIGEIKAGLRLTRMCRDDRCSCFAKAGLRVTIAPDDGRAAMRWCVSIGAVLVAGAMAGDDVASIAAPNPGNQPQLTQKDATPSVDVELILAVDVSYSMDMDELAIQREGYAQAIISKEFLQALKAGPTGKIAVTYFEWAASSDQKIIIPWRVIDGPETADAVANEIMKTPIRRASRTSISGAIYFAMPLFDENPYRGLRRVIDISGDGPNNNGAPVIGAREEALAKGITINGLPIMVKEPSYSTMDIDNLDWYYEDCVIGGPGSFVVSIKDREKFKEAIRTKLLLEVAGRTPEHRIVPVAEKEPRVPCLIGEKIWQDRWGR
jgi:Protein of unknown function (DUF1194)